jgi:hypothetical protein
MRKNQIPTVRSSWRYVLELGLFLIVLGAGDIQAQQQNVVNSTGPVGIGVTTNLTTSLTVGRDLELDSYTDGTSTRWGLLQAYDRTSGARPMWLEASRFFFNSGNVGIGTTNPVNRLTLYGTSADASTSANNGLFTLSNSNGVQLSLGAAVNSPYGIFFQTKDGNNSGPYHYPILLNPLDGNVGIGTSNPGDKLEVRAGTNQRFVVGSVSGYTAPSDFASGGVYLALSRPEDGALTGALYSYNTSGGAKNNLALSSRSDIVFLTASGPNNAVERMRVLENGNFGIGSTNPVYGRLQVEKTSAGQVIYSVSHSTSGTNYGIDAEATGNNADANVAGYFAAAGASNNHNYAIIVPAGLGNVGIGTSTPDTAYKLHVEGDLKLAGTGNLTANGTIEAGNIKAKYQDVAEWVPASEQLSAGTVVVLDSSKSNQVTSSSTSYDTRVAGVISEQPGIALGEKSEGKVLVATTGRVRVKVDATKGSIHVGDLLVTSDIPGVAMKSEPMEINGRKFHQPGTLIGKALEPLEKGKGEILVLLSLQ